MPRAWRCHPSQDDLDGAAPACRDVPHLDGVVLSGELDAQPVVWLRRCHRQAWLEHQAVAVPVPLVG